MKRLYPILLSIVFLSACSKTSVESIPIDNVDLPASNNKSVGASANDLLSGVNFNRLVVQIHYMPGMQVQQNSINNFVNFINQRLNKAGGVEVRVASIPASGKASLNITEVAALEKKYRTAFNNANQIAIYILVADAVFEQNTVLGVAYRNTSIALFGKTIQNNSGAIGQASREKVETVVLNHELGHLLGLVDNGTTMQQPHKDAANGAHCNNSNCLMYWNVNTSDFLGFLATANIPGLDANCIADLRANGGK